jgi:RimJ/RimL family protein N-acetyltransferase
MSVGWEGEKVRLVPLDREKHLENALIWLNDPETSNWLLVGDFPLTRLAEEEYFEQTARSSEDHAHFAIETLEGQHIGFTGFLKIEWRHRTATSGTVIGPGEFRRQGYGTDALKVRTRYGFEVLGLRLLLTEAMAENVASCRTLQKVGYREVGRIPRRYWRRGAYRDVLLFALDREWWSPAGPDVLATGR